MAAPTYATQLDEAKEALALIVAGQLESHSTLAGQFKHWTPAQLRDHVDWLEDKAREEAIDTGGTRAGKRQVGFAKFRGDA